MSIEVKYSLTFHGIHNYVNQSNPTVKQSLVVQCKPNQSHDEALIEHLILLFCKLWRFQDM